MSWLDYKIEPFKPKTLALIAIAILISAIAMWPCLDNEFTNWDDGKYIMENDLVKDLTASNVYKMFFEKDLKGRSYVPLSLVTWAIEYDIWQDNPAPYHRHNLILHLCNVVMIFFFILYISSRIEIAFITAVLFGIHPMHVESVAWITERKDVLYTFLYFSSLICYVKYLKQGANSLRLYLFTLILFFLSTTAKSSAVTLTGVLFLLDFLAHRKLDRKLILEKIPFFIITVVMGVITVIAAQSTDTIASADAFSLFERFMFASYGMITYIAKMVVPFHLAAYYPYPNLIEGRLPYIFYFAPVIAAGVFYAVYRSYEKTRIVVFGFLFYFFNVVLVLQFLSVGPTIMSERYSYVSYVGLFFLVGHLYIFLKEHARKNIRTLGVVMSVALPIAFISYGIITHDRCKVWKNPVTLWTDMIEKYPYTDHGYTKRGSYYGKNGDYDKAFKDYQISIQLKPEDFKVFNNMGNIYGSRGQYNEAIEHFKKALEISPEYADAYLNIGITYSMMKQPEKSFEYYDKAIEMGLTNLKVYTNRAQTFYAIKDYSNAIADYSLVLQTRRFDPISLMYRGLSYYFLGDYDSAITDFNLLLQVEPQNQYAFNNRSLCYKEKQQFELALSDALNAKKLGLDVKDQYINNLKTQAGVN